MRKLFIIIALLTPLLTLAQGTRQIKGQILDRTDGSVLAGATVFIDPSQTQAKNYNPQGTIADNKGHFVFTLPTSVKFVMVSFLGYEAMKVDISTLKEVTVRLTAVENELDAVVVTGYQKIEKRKLTSSIATVKIEDMNRVGVASVDQMLEGQLAGVVSTPTSGAPGAGSAVKIRSTVTLNGNTAPLWVLDGMPLEGNEIPSDWSAKENIDNLYNMSIAGMNPDDIKDITVLKDAAATAIYGARAANGVIIITTKRGEKGQSLRVNASLATFITDRPNIAKLNLLNASQKVDLELNLASNGRLNHLKDMGGVARILDRANERGTLMSGGFDALSPETQQSINNLRKNGTDWANEIYRMTINQQYSINVSGGGQRATYYFSAGYYNEQGTTRGTGFERFNLTLKSDFDIFKNLRFGAAVYVGQNKNESYLSDTDAFMNPGRYTRSVNPYLNARDADGNYIYDPDMIATVAESKTINYNYFEELEQTSYEMSTRSLKSVFDLDFTPVKGLRLYSQLGLQVENGATEKAANENSYFVRKYSTYAVINQQSYLPQGGVIQNWNSDLFQYNWKAQAEYSKSFNKIHEIDLMAGLEMRATTSTNIHTKGFGYDHRTLVTKPIVFPNTPTGISLADNRYFKQYQNSFYENRYLSYFFTGSYTFDNRFTFFGSMRYDGTNLFGVDPKYKFNPMWSVSGAWNINREQFMKEQRWVSNLRLRASYGVQGNIDRSTSPYIKGTWNNTNIGGGSEDRINVTSPPNQNLRWETTYSWNTAIDFGVLENKLNMTFEAYGRKSKDLITVSKIPHETGFLTTSSNYGQISSRGLELSINSVNISNKNFRWQTTFNIAHNRDNVDKINIKDNDWSPSLLGYSSDAVFGYKMAGLDDKGIPMLWDNGKRVTLQEFVGFKVEDSNPGMNSSFNSVRDKQEYLGSRTPKFTGGLNNRFQYKGFDLSISANFVIKQLVTESPFYNPMETSPDKNYTTAIYDIWSPSNPNGKYPSLTGSLRPDGTSWGSWDNYDDYRVMNNILSNYPVNIFSNLDIWSKEMSYLRINSIRLGYSLPENIVKKLHLASVRVSLEARNPFVIAGDYSGFFDPETYGNIYTQPVARTYSIGLNISF